MLKRCPLKKICFEIISQVVGSGGGVLAGGLTVAGGVMTVMTAGAALPVLVAVRPRIFNRKVHAFKKICPKSPETAQGASLGLASGITGGAAAITKKVLNSQQMKKVEVAIEVNTTCQSHGAHIHLHIS